MNLDVERVSAQRPGLPDLWSANGAGFEVTLDSAVHYSGVRSLRIRRVGEGRYATAGVPIAASLFNAALGHRIRVSATIRTDSVTEGHAGLWVGVDGSSGSLATAESGTTGPHGTTGWVRYAVEVDVPRSAVNIAFGALLMGKGTAWFDHFSVEVLPASAGH